MNENETGIGAFASSGLLKLTVTEEVRVAFAVLALQVNTSTPFALVDSEQPSGNPDMLWIGRATGPSRCT